MTDDKKPDTDHTGKVPPGWEEVLKASQDAGDPPAKRFREVLTCKLSDAEHRSIGQKYADTVVRRKAFETKTKALIQERKNELAQIVESEDKLLDVFRTQREEREVDIVEMTSFRLGKTWKMRLDTYENYAERALTAAERQPSLPHTKQTELPLQGDGKGADVPIAPTSGKKMREPGEDDEEVDEEEEELAANAIQNPQDLLDDANDGVDDEDEDDDESPDSEE